MKKRTVLFVVFAAILALALGVCAGCGSKGAADQINVNISIDATAAGGELIEQDVAIDEGGTVYDALAAVAQISGEPSYVTGINGVDAAENSGWCYYVNGEYPNNPANEAVVVDGDDIDWVFVVF